MADKFVWNELLTREPEKCQKFYGTLFGWTATEANNPHVPYTIFMGNKDERLAGMLKLDEHFPADLRSHWLPYIGVTDVEQVARDVPAHGGKVRVPPTQIPYVGTFAILEDPSGAVFSVIRFEGQS